MGKLPINLGPFVTYQDEEIILDKFIVDEYRENLWIVDNAKEIFITVSKMINFFPRDFIYSVFWDTFDNKEKDVALKINYKNLKKKQNGKRNDKVIYQIIKPIETEYASLKSNFLHNKEALDLGMVKDPINKMKILDQPYLDHTSLILEEINGEFFKINPGKRKRL